MESKVTFSIITPTEGRKGTGACISYHLGVLSPHDEYIVVAEGYDKPFVLSDGGLYRPIVLPEKTIWGNAARDYGIAKAIKSHIICIDDDDKVPNLEDVRKAVATNPRVPHLFCINGAGIGWNWLTEQPEEHIAGHCMVIPNDKKRIKSWVEYVNSRPYIEATLKEYNNEHKRHPDIILNTMREFDRTPLVS